MKHDSLLIIIFVASLIQGAFMQSACSNIDPGDGVEVYRLKQLFYSMVFPHTFTIALYPGHRCYYVSNNMLQAEWYSPAVEGTLYVYGWNGYDGKNLNSCQLQYQTPINQEKKYFTAHSIFLWWSNRSICSMVLFVQNSGAATDHITIGKHLLSLTLCLVTMSATMMLLGSAALLTALAQFL